MGEIIISLPVVVIVFVIIAIGDTIVSKIVFKKWGYTRKREKELEDLDEKAFFLKKRKKWYK